MGLKNRYDSFFFGTPKGINMSPVEVFQRVEAIYTWISIFNIKFFENRIF
jgi:hypothetical protein